MSLTSYLAAPPRNRMMRGEGWESQSWQKDLLTAIKKTGQLFDSEVGENTSIDIEDWGF